MLISRSLLFFLASLANLSAYAQQSIPQILGILFDSTQGNRWNNYDGWYSSNPYSYCNWSGITCYDVNESEETYGQIETLDLTDNRLVGFLPSEVYSLPYLRNLILKDNPDLIVGFEGVENAYHLHRLVLSNTLIFSFDGLDQIQSDLEEIHLTGCDLQGPFPLEITAISSLRAIYANYNYLNGYLPTEIGNLVNLEELYMFSNEFEGPIPSTIGYLTNLNSLVLSNNNFSGQLPVDAFDSLTQLNIISLANNAIEDRVPAFDSLTNLEELYLQNNFFHGNIPRDFLWNAPKDAPIIVDLRNNMISGTLSGYRLTDFARLNILLADNFIESIEQHICSKSDWLNGDVGEFSCSGILCPVGTYASEGRQTSLLNQCEVCESVEYMGSTSCESEIWRVLRLFYDALNGEKWMQNNWFQNNDECTWDGIACDGFSITELNLSGYGLVGTPPADIFTLPGLRLLDLSNNFIDFSFNGISMAKDLVVLDVSSTGLTSVKGIEELIETPIEELYLESNDISGVIPEAIYDLSTLKILKIRHNKFSGTLSSSIQQLSSLILFDAYGNILSGRIPDTIGALSETLVILDLSENDFTGTIPESLSNMPFLEALSIHQKTNRSGGLSGPVPSFAYSSRLQTLLLYSNSLSGNLPDSFMQFSHYLGESIKVDLSRNQITGEIPSAWSRFDYLDLNLANNRIDHIPGAICNMQGWLGGAVALHSSCDSILCDVGSFSSLGRHTDYSPCVSCSNAVYMGATSCGDFRNEEILTILEAFYYSTDGDNWYINSGWLQGRHYCDEWHGIVCDNDGVHIVSIDLSDNGLSGIPSSLIFSIPRLQKLDLGSNNIDFDFKGIEAAKDLKILRLSETRVSSINGIGYSVGLQYLHLTDCYLSGTIPEELFNLTQLRGLYMNYNQLTGRLPRSIGNLNRLEELFLLRNGLGGQIPATIGDLSNIKVLAIAENRFTGSIPSEINKLENLQILALQGEGEGYYYDPSYYYSSSGTDDYYSDVSNGYYSSGYYQRNLRRNVGDKGTMITNKKRKLNSQTNTSGLRGPLPSLDRAKNLHQIYLGDNSLTGTIPYSFLSGVVDKTKSILINLQNNYLSGVVPASLTQFNELDIYLGGNEFSDIAPGLCVMKSWLGGQVAQANCNAILCPKNTFSPSGMSDMENTCAPCPTSTVAPFMGSFECISEDEQIAKSERKILESIYTSTNGIGWLSNDFWMDKDISICEWYGITCVPGKESVQSINLQMNSLTGSIQGTIFHLTNLQSLNLAENDVILSFEHIDDASHVEYINVDSTQTRSFANINNAPSLLILHAKNLKLQIFPEEIVALNNLQTLFLSNNQFGSAIPDLSSFSELKFFQCDRCDLIGGIPQWFGDLEQLEYLSLAGNMLTGPIPSSLTQLTSLVSLNLSDQTPRGGGLSGKVPSFSNLRSIKELYLNKNILTGSIPADFMKGVYGMSVAIDLRNNKISGSIPEVLGTSFDVINFLLAGNQITGIPESICNITSGWNGGDIKKYGCDGFLCSKGFYSPIGRKTDGDLYDCVACDDLTADAQVFYGSTSCGSNDELEALKAIYSALDGPDWINNDGWLENDAFCSWYGVECDDGLEHVTALILDSNGLVGDLPEELFSLTSLTHLRMKSNDISFDFDGIEQLPKLESLYLSETKITSLSGIGKAKSLRKFHATGNDITAIPDELYGLTNLEELYLNYCNIQGTLSPKLGQLTKLKELYLLKNQLKGTLPSEISNLSFLEVLGLGENNFSGEIPSALSSLPNINKIALQRSTPQGASPGGPVDTAKLSGGLTGNVPAFDKTPKLSELLLGYNNLEGSLPTSFLSGIVDKASEIIVDLTLNQISGSLPSSLSKFAKLSIFLSGNKMNEFDQKYCEMYEWMDGTVKYRGCDAILCPPGTYNEYGRETNEGPTCIACPFTYTAPFYGSVSCTPDITEYDEREILKKFYISTGGSKWLNSDNWLDDNISICNWHGVICKSEITEGGASMVAELHLPSNKLNGFLPPHIFRLKHLKTLNVRENKIDIQMNAIDENDQLEELFLDFTLLSSLEGVSKFKSLRTLHLQKNNFRGTSLPEELFSLTLLENLYISDSNIGGLLSPSIAKLANLKYLFCHGNNMNGEIPKEIGQLYGLRALVLSENNFVGPLPTEISNLENLESLFLDKFTKVGAGLSGPLPSFDSMKKLRQLQLAENSFTGTIPLNFLGGIVNLEDTISVGLKGNRIEGSVPSALSRFQRLNIVLSDNLITSIDGDLCFKTMWMNGDVGKYNCEAILCPPGYYNQYGRQSSSLTECQKCSGIDQSVFLGATRCQSEIRKREREILEIFYDACGGNNWKSKNNWMSEKDICSWFGVSCSNGGLVDSIILASNNLSGAVPKEVFELDHLKFLWLYSNPVGFSFSGIGRAKSLKSLLLDSTGLKSLEGIGQAYQLTDLDVRFNRIKGKVPLEISNLVNLESLSMSDNSLTGELPSFNRMHKLKSLRIANNHITGSLPTFASNNNLKTIDLSDNRISGKILPTFLDSVPSWENMYVDLSRNRIEGTIPGDLARFDKMTLYVKDNYITSIDNDVCQADMWNNGDVGSYKCNGVLCPPGTYAPGSGRQSVGGTECFPCKKADFYGQSMCVDLYDHYSSAFGLCVQMVSTLVIFSVTTWLIM